ncbi:MAG: type II toxin-antitoxin system prevent-host-death family antitoxin [Patescibacteria group bacterium]|nr:type II toxin-antitoxin system prevent-host-death family antitoxin [Patescibacteria group bacterium]
MLEVKIEKILPVTEARDSFNKLIDEVEGTDELYVLTKNGKPAAVLVGVHHLEKLTGTSEEELMDQTNIAASNDDSGAPIAATDSLGQDTSSANTATTPEIKNDQLAGETAAVETTPEEAPSSTPIEAKEPSDNTIGSSNAATAVENQQSGATANPFENAAAPTSTDNTPAEDPLDFLNDSDADPIPATPATPAAPDSAMNTPSAMPPAGDATQAEAPTTTGPTPMPAPEAPAPNPTFPPAPPTQPGV